MAKTHWKKFFDYNYLGSHDLEHGQDLIATIKNVEQRQVIVPQTGKKQEKPVLVFEENIKPMILNPTNSRNITAVVGSNYVEDWKGQKVIIYIDQKIKLRKDVVEGLRIKMQKPTPSQKPRLNTSMSQWAEAVKGVAGGVTLEQIRTKYSISNDVWAELKAEAEKYERNDS